MEPVSVYFLFNFAWYKYIPLPHSLFLTGETGSEGGGYT